MNKTGDAFNSGKLNSSAKKITLLVIFILLIAFAVISLFVRGGTKDGKIIGRGDRAPEFSLQTLDGRTVSLGDFRGKVVMVHFWATWCPPCVEEMPTIERLYRSLRIGDFEILAVSVDEGGAGAVAAFMQQNRLSLPVLLDPGRSTAGRYGTFKFPETYIIDRQGMVAYKAIGPRDWTDPANVNMIRETLQVISAR